MSEVADAIFRQLGGQKFRVMTGSKNFVSGTNWLTFRIPMSKGVNLVRIRLLPGDMYLMQFFKVQGLKNTEIAYHEGIYADQLQATFTEVTGLRTSL